VLLLFTFLLTASSTKYWLYAGAGGCDSDDPNCVSPSPTDLSTIYILQYDSTTGNISLESKQTGFGPNWLRVHPSKKYLFTFNRNGAVVSLAVDAKTGALSPINSVNAPGGCVFIDVDPPGTNLFVAAYGQGAIGAYPINPTTGQIGSITSSLQFHGHGPNPSRQDGPHPHSINVDPKSNGRFVFIPDLGLDTVFSFEVVSGVFKNTTYTNTTRLYPGAGPRHMAFHPTLSVAYVLSEMGSTVTAYKLDSSLGRLSVPPLQNIATLPQGFNGFSKAAEIRVEPSGKWLFASNRGYAAPTNSITVYEIAADSGMLTERGRYPYGGTFPRGMELSPEGDVLVVGGQDTNNVVTLKFDKNTGMLTPTGSVLTNIASPVTFAFVPQM